MALGAVLFSLPMALCMALYGYVLQGMSTMDGLIIYSVMGTAILISFTLLNGMRFEDLP